MTARATICFPATENPARTTCLVLGSSERRLAASISIRSLSKHSIYSNPAVFFNRLWVLVTGTFVSVHPGYFDLPESLPSKGEDRSL